MELFYAALFGFMAIAAAALELGKPKEGVDSSLTRDFIRFSRYRDIKSVERAQWSCITPIDM